MAENEAPKKAEGTGEAVQVAPAKAAPLAPEAQAAPLTSEEFTARLDQLVTRAKAAGLRPLQVMAATYVQRGLAVLDGLLSALDESGTKKPSVTEAPDAPTKKA